MRTGFAQGPAGVVQSVSTSNRDCAVNVDTGKITWQSKTEQPMMGGALATAGNLVFAGEANGLFKAYDATTGKALWQFQGGAGVNSAPMSFEVDGKQHIAVAAGALYAFAAWIIGLLPGFPMAAAIHSRPLSVCRAIKGP